MANLEATIGKEEGLHRLKVRIGAKEYALGAPQSVPNSVSRAHCSLSVDYSDDASRKVTKIRIKNLKVQNVTYVDGQEIDSKQIGENALVELGFERYTLNLKQLINSMRQLLSPPPPEEYSISYLSKVWQEYDEAKLKISEDSMRSANKQRLQGLLSMLGVGVGLIPGMDNSIRIGIVVAAILIGAYFFIKGASGTTVQKKMHDLDEEFRKKYICPNPDCRHFVGNIPYDILRQNKNCPYCKCRYKEV